MVSLSTPGGPAARLQSQIGEAVAEIASVDFPERWPNLLDVSDFLVRVGVVLMGVTDVGYGQQLVAG
jgi:hypothetical protein